MSALFFTELNEMLLRLLSSHLEAVAQDLNEEPLIYHSLSGDSTALQPVINQYGTSHLTALAGDIVNWAANRDLLHGYL